MFCLKRNVPSSDEQAAVTAAPPPPPESGSGWPSPWEPEGWAPTCGGRVTELLSPTRGPCRKPQAGCTHTPCHGLGAATEVKTSPCRPPGTGDVSGGPMRPPMKL